MMTDEDFDFLEKVFKKLRSARKRIRKTYGCKSS